MFYIYNYIVHILNVTKLIFDYLYPFFTVQDLEVDDYSLAKVLILVTDENDNAPVFQANHYYAGQISIEVKYFDVELKYVYLKMSKSLNWNFYF